MAQEVNDKYLPSHIANYFLWKARKEDLNDVTPMKLIKLVYIGYAWYYAIYDKKLFAEQIQAWQYGPVIPSIYHEFKRFGSSPISNYAIEFGLDTGETSYPIVMEKDEEILQVLGAVWEIYKNKSGTELSKITHEEDSPWHYAFYGQGVNSPLSDEQIRERAGTAILKHKKVENA
jgi:hypothetical protein